MTTSYIIKVNGAWLTEFKYGAITVRPVGSDVKQDAEVFEGLGEVIAAMRVIQMWQRMSCVDVAGISVEEAEE